MPSMVVSLNGGSTVIYHMMRLFLTSREAPPLLEFINTGKRTKSRQEYLKEKLGTNVRFEHRNKWYVYKFFEIVNDHYLAAVISKEHTVTISSSPEENFKQKEVPDWETVNVFIDTSGEADGQKVAMQVRNEIGVPLAVFQSLINHLNNKYAESEWMMAVNAITEERDFWEAAKTYNGRISEINLSFVTPNIWKGSSETEEALKELHNLNNAQTVEVSLKNPDKKLDPDSSRIRESVNYITRGGGNVRLKEGPRTVYDSEKKIATHTESDDVAIQNTMQDATTDLLLEIIKRVLGR